MEVDLIFKIAAVGILVAVLNILLSRSGREEQGLMVTLAGLLVVLIIMANVFIGMVRSLSRASRQGDIPLWLMLMFLTRPPQSTIRFSSSAACSCP